jgi:small ligand-binding sensory domain FIST
MGDGLALGDDLVDAAVQAVGAALRQLGPGPSPDLAVVWVSGGDPDQTAQALEAAAAAASAGTSIGCTAHGVVGAGHAVEADRAVGVWLARLPGATLRSFHLEVLRTSDSIAVVGMPDRRPADVVGILLADPWSFPAEGFVERSSDVLEGLPLVGGLVSGADSRGDARLMVDGKVHGRGAVGVVLSGDVAVRTLVSQGCRPIGRPMTVTASEGAVLRTLAGRPALEQAHDAIAELAEEERALAMSGLHVGVAMDEYVEEHAASDFLARGIVDADSDTGTITVGDLVPVGSTVQFLLRDSASASGELSDVLTRARHELGTVPLAGALLFTCSGRGRAMFPTPEHDIAAVRTALGLEHVGGFFAGGEIGPVETRNHLHTFTATLLAFESEA